MIWNSVPLMTAIDLLIIAVTLYGIWRCRPFIRGRRPSASRIGVWLVASGLLVVCLFYAADLISMHALPATSSSARFGAASPTQLCERFRTSSDRKVCGRGTLENPPGVDAGLPITTLKLVS
jgi:hypothetical protein